MIQHVLTMENGVCSVPLFVVPPDAQTVQPAPTAPAVVQWLDVEGGLDELAMVLAARGLPSSLARRVEREPHFPLVLAGDSFLLLRVPVRRVWKQPKSEYMTLLLLPGEVITLNRQQEGRLEDERARLTEAGAQTARDAAGLLLYLLDSLLSANVTHFIALRSETELLSEKINLNGRRPIQTVERETLLIRRQANRLINQFQDDLFALTELLALLPHPLLGVGGKGRLRAVAEAQNHVNGNLRQLVTRHNDLQQQCHYLLQQQTDNRISRLTVLSAIFMPLTLIAGIFGMNFKYMTGLDWEYGYTLTLGVMALLGLGLWLGLKKKGWW